MAFAPRELDTSAVQTDELRSQVHDAGVVVIRGLRLDLRQFVRIVEALGPMAHPWDAPRVAPAESRVQDMRVDADADQGERTSSAQHWHSDQSFALRPPAFTALYCLDAPRSGGGTEFCTSRLKHLDGRLAMTSPGNAWIRHSFRESLGVLLRGRRNAEQLTALTQRFPDVWHPLLRRQPGTDASALFLSPLTAREIRISDQVSATSSSETFAELLRVTTEGHNVYTHIWQAHDLLLWDNAAVMHRRALGRVRGARRHWRAVTCGISVRSAEPRTPSA